jgi:DNA-binding response OmpR family regulator
MNTQKPLLLIVDDENYTLTIVRRVMEREGYRVLTAKDSQTALAMFEQHTPSLVIADIMMAGMDGFALCQQIREFSRVPVILLTAKLDLEDKLRGFELGADDYITKPFSKEELLARVRAVLSRTQVVITPPDPEVFKLDDLEIDFQHRMVVKDGAELSLTPTEYRLLSELVLHKGKILTYNYLLTTIWGSEYKDETQYLHVLIRRLRTKIELDAKNPKHVQTVFGVGYEFKV